MVDSIAGLVLVDTSVLVSLMRGRASDAVETLRQLHADAVPYAIPLFCMQELLQGARDEREWATLHSYLSAQLLIGAEEDALVYTQAARIYYDCRRIGVTLRSSIDCFIAAQALVHDAWLLHEDSDFEHMKRVVRLKTLPKK